MIFTDVRYKIISFPLIQPFTISHKTIIDKNIIIIRATDESGKIYYGEVSPLIGFSEETITDCASELEALIKNNAFSIDIDRIRKNIIPSIKNPSLKFGVEQLLFINDIKNGQITFPQNRVVKINALLGIQSFEKSIEYVEEIVQQGFDTIKIKIGRNNFKSDLEIISEVYKLNPKIKIRLDNNATWDYNTTISNLKKLEKFNIEYFEQPVHNFDELKIIAKNSNIPIAPDESIINYEIAKKIIEEKIFDNIVLKPSLKIGIFDSIKIIELAKKNNTKVIITSAFETVIGRTVLLFMAGLIDENIAHGLNTELIGQEKIITDMNFNIPQIELPNKLVNPNLTFDF